jgi:DNA-binding LacI/PurR family transcriptional regulator
MDTENGTQATRKRRPAVMADVAKLAEVSHQTVSRVINGSPQVRPATRERVLAAMQKLGYRPNTMARALATGRSRTLGVVGFDTTLYGPATALFGINQAAHEEGYFISTVSMRTLDRSSILEAVERLRVQGVEGVLVIAPQTESAQAVLQLPNDLPVVALQTGPEAGISFVSGDSESGAIQATQHLLQLGHETVWHIAGPESWFEARQRVAGWERALRAVGLEPPPALRGDWSPHSGYELGKQLAADASVTAVFAANDHMALGLLRALSEAGRSVPGEVCVVGFDDVPEAAYFTPPLTTVRQDFAELGRQSFHLLLKEIERDTRSATRLTVKPELIVRASTTSL